jgi:hypothetical protein
MAKDSFGSATQLNFVMPTWNPYEVMLMTTRLSKEVFPKALKLPQTQ